MESLEGVLKLVDNELDVITKNGKFRGRDEVDAVYKLVDIAKDIYCIWQYEEEGYSEDYYGNSYARKRDRMGRYSRNYPRTYSRDDGYAEELRDMMNRAPDEQTRQSIQRMIDQMH